MQANIESFVGAAQVPIGVAGPLGINGEHAVGDFSIPLATTEGTLVASYSRGMRLLTACGGVTMTVVADVMQRAPVFLFGARGPPGMGAHMVEARFRREHPDAPEDEVAARVRAWWLDRPGAPDGDAVGRARAIDLSV